MSGNDRKRKNSNHERVQRRSLGGRSISNLSDLDELDDKNDIYAEFSNFEFRNQGPMHVLEVKKVNQQGMVLDLVPTSSISLGGVHTSETHRFNNGMKAKTDSGGTTRSIFYDYSNAKKMMEEKHSASTGLSFKSKRYSSLLNHPSLLF